MNRPEFFDIMSLVEDEHINILYERRAKAAENKLSAKGGKKLITLWFKRIALVLVTTATVLAGILMLHEDVRAAVVNAFITWYDTYIQIDFSKIPEDTAQIDGTTDTVPADKEPEADTETQEPVENIYDLAVGYIPSGFKSVYTIEDNYTREYSYDDEDGNSLLIGIYDSKGTEVGVSNDDNYEYEKLLINNRETYVAYNEQEGIGSVSFGNDVYCVLISGASITDVLDKETLIKIAENIRKKDDTEDKEQTQEVKDIYKFEIGYIPDGFELMGADESSTYRNYTYYNKIGEYLNFYLATSGTTEIFSSIEKAECNKITVNGNDAYILYYDSEKNGTIMFGNSVYTVLVSGVIEKNELIKIAESIK